MKATQALAVNKVSEAAMIGGKRFFQNPILKDLCLPKATIAKLFFYQILLFSSFWLTVNKLNMERDCNTASVKCFFLRAVGKLELLYVHLHVKLYN